MHRRPPKTWVWVLLALVAGMALRLYFVAVTPQLSGDTLVYGDLAKNLAEHHVYGFTVAGGAPRPTLIRVPGYPLFLAFCFELFGVEHYRPVLYIQAAVDLASCLLVAGLARRLFGAKAGLAALWLAALCPFTANYADAALTETLTLFCIAAAFYGADRWRDADFGYSRWLCAVSGALAFALLLRPEQGLLAAAVLPGMLWMVWQKGRSNVSLRTAVPVIVGAMIVVLPLLPWAVRNYRVFHVFQPLAPRFANDPNEAVPRGFQRWYRTWAIDFASTENVYWNYDGNDINIADLPDRAFDSEEQFARVDSLLTEYNLTDQATAKLDSAFNKLAQERIHADPLRYYFTLPLARLANMLLRPRTELMSVGLEWWKVRVYRGQTVFALFYAGINLAYFFVACLGVNRMRKAGHIPTVVWSMILYFGLRCALLLTLDNSEPRYTLEFFPILCLLCSGIVASSRINEQNARLPAPGESRLWLLRHKSRLKRICILHMSLTPSTSTARSRSVTWVSSTTTLFKHLSGCGSFKINNGGSDL